MRHLFAQDLISWLHLPSLLSSVLVAASAQAQMSEEWLARFGPDRPGTWTVASAIAVDADGNAYVTGNARREDGSGWDLILLKYSAIGELLYVNRLGDAIGQTVVIDRDNNVVVGGTYRASADSDSDFIIAKYSRDGIQLWSARYDGPIHGDDYLMAVAVDEAGNVYATGRTAALPWSDYVTLKYCSGGQPLWEAFYHGSGPGIGDDHPYAMALDSTGNIYVSGHSSARFGTIKYAPDGTRLWVAQSEGPIIDGAAALALDGDDNIYVAGESLRFFSPPTQFDKVVLVIKYDRAGNALWNQTYRGLGYNSVNAVAVDAGDNLFVVGSSDPSGFAAWWVLKYSSDGNLLWVDEYQPSVRNHAYAVAVDNSGNAYVTGDANGMTTIKYSPDGVRQWRATIGSFLTGVGVGVAVHGQAVYATGRASGRVTAQAVTAKYPQDFK